MPILTTTKFAFVSSSYTYLFPIILIPQYLCTPSLFYCSLIPLDLIAFTLIHNTSSSPYIAPLRRHMHPVLDHTFCTGVLSSYCIAIIVAKYTSCHIFLLFSLITSLVNNYSPSHVFAFLLRILVPNMDSFSCYKFSCLLQILVVVRDSYSCYGFLFLLQIHILVTDSHSCYELYCLLVIIIRVTNHLSICTLFPVTSLMSKFASLPPATCLLLYLLPLFPQYQCNIKKCLIA